MTSVNMIFFMGGPQLGELEAGVVASLFASVATGATVAVVSGGLVDAPRGGVRGLAGEDRARVRLGVSTFNALISWKRRRDFSGKEREERK